MNLKLFPNEKLKQMNYGVLLWHLRFLVWISVRKCLDFSCVWQLLERPIDLEEREWHFAKGLLSSYQVQKCPHHLPGSNLPSLGQINAKVGHTGLELLRSDLLINTGSPLFFYYPRLLFNESTSLFLMFPFDVYLKHIPASRVWVF